MSSLINDDGMFSVSASEASARNIEFLPTFIVFLINKVLVKFVVCVRYNRIFAYCVPTRSVLRTVYPPPLNTGYKGRGVTLIDVMYFVSRLSIW